MSARLNRSRRSAAVVLLSPAMIVIGVFIVVPIFLTLWISLHEWSMFAPITEMQWVGLDNYAKFLESPTHLQAFWNTFVYAGLSVLILVPLSFLVGSLLYFPKLKGSGALRVILFSTYVLPTAAVALIWGNLYASYGPIAGVLTSMGIAPPSWLSSPDTALISLVVLNVWQTLGYYVVLVVAGLTQIPGELYEAAKLDGAGSLREMWSITLPMSKNTMFFVLLITLVNSIQVFDPIYLLTTGGPLNATNVVSYDIQKTAFQQGLAGQASAMAFGLFLIIALVGCTIAMGSKMRNNWGARRA